MVVVIDLVVAVVVVVLLLLLLLLLLVFVVMVGFDVVVVVGLVVVGVVAWLTERFASSAPVCMVSLTNHVPRRPLGNMVSEGGAEASRIMFPEGRPGT